VNQATGVRQPYLNNQIPSAEFSKATTTMWKTYFPAATSAGTVDNFTSAAASG